MAFYILNELDFYCDEEDQHSVGSFNTRCVTLQKGKGRYYADMASRFTDAKCLMYNDSEDLLWL